MVLTTFLEGGYHQKEDGSSVKALTGVLQSSPGAFSWEELGFSTGKWPHPGGALPEARAMHPLPRNHPWACRSWRWDELLASTGELQGGKQSKRPAGGP